MDLDPKYNNPFLKQPRQEDLDDMQCGSCGNTVFDRFFKLYKWSALKNGSGKDQIFNVPVYACANCGEVVDLKLQEKTQQPAPQKKEETEEKSEEIKK